MTYLNSKKDKSPTFVYPEKFFKGESARKKIEKKFYTQNLADNFGFFQKMDF